MTDAPDSDAARSSALARYRALFNAIDDGFCIIEFFDGPHGPLSDYVHIEANTGYERHTGIRDIVGKTLREIDPTDADRWIDLYGAVLRTGAPARFERYFLTAGRHIEVSATRVEPQSLRQVAVLFRDISARRKAEEDRDRADASLRALNETLEQRVAERTAELMRAEEQLRQSQKMEAVGQLTGGLAHDFNNLLAGVSGSLQLLSIRLSQGRVADVDKYVVAAQGAVRRAAGLTHRLLAFSRRQTLDPRPTDVNALVNGMTDLIQRTVGPGIKVEAVGAAGLWPALVDSGQLENALLNLCINARDAMPDGGRITIETANKWIDRRAAQSHDMPEGQFLSLCVTDTGTGMTRDVIAKAFDPFFTTKPIGMGTGLGLSMIYGFAKQSGGQVRIYSEVGQGTTVCIYLPRFYGDADGEAADPSASPISSAEAGETVLIVDDEPSVRMLIVDVLEEAGYSVIEAADSVAGLKLLQSNVRIDLLISDVGLPGGMNGRQMADAARQARPGLKVLFITGYAENSVIGHGRLEPGMQVLTKPFAIETLAARVRQLIQG
jgi:signal transduction histidine kinase/CheY-like chemotaxis protein